MIEKLRESVNRPTSAIQALGLASLLVVLATAATTAIDRFGGHRFPYLLYACAILAAAGWGSMACGIATTILSAAIVNFWFLGSRFQFAVPATGDAISLSLFVAQGVFISWAVTRLQRASEDHTRVQANEREGRFDAETDVTRLRELGGNLRDGETRFRSIFEQAACGIAQTDLAGRFLWVNDQFCQIVGIPSNKLLVMQMKDLIHPGDRFRNLELFERLVNSGDEFVGEERYIRSDGTFVWVNNSVSAVLDEQGNPQYIVLVMQDVTQRKCREEESALHCERLERLMIERTDALRKSMELVHSLDRLASIGTLAAGIAHEVNNPLNAILLTAEWVLRTHRSEDDAELKEALKTISQEARRGGRIVQGILQFVREEPSIRAPCDLNALAQNAVKLARTCIPPPKEFIVSFELGENLPLVFVNSTELEMVVVNLLKNAFQVAQDKLHIIVKTRKIVPCGVELVLKGNGPGIPDNEKAQILDPFFSMRGGPAGVGLGLSLCHRIIEDHGGSILLSGPPGEGIIGTISLPQHDAGQSQSSMINGENI